jgi:hypothetical protein
LAQNKHIWQYVQYSAVQYSTLCIVRTVGGSHDWTNAEWIVIRKLTWGHKDTPFGRPTVGRPSGRIGVDPLTPPHYYSKVNVLASLGRTLQNTSFEES